MEEWINKETGVWTGDRVHKTDTGLTQALCDIVKDQETLVDFGCGDASYAKAIAATGLKVEAYDGNTDVGKNSGGFASVLDLSESFDLKKKFDVVVSLEVAEHLPKKYEEIYVNNLIKHTNRYIIMSWAEPGQGGSGHFNEQSNEYVIELMKNKGFTELNDLSQYLRKSVTHLWWFRNTSFVFLKES